MTAAPTLHRIALATAAVAGAFVVLIAAVLAWQFATATTNDPWKSPQLLELKERLRTAPKDEAVKTKIRELDLRFRQDYRRRLRLAASGGWLIVAGSALAVLALQTAAEAKRRLPQPHLDHDAAAKAVRTAAQSRRAVATAGGLALVSMLAVGFAIRSGLDEKESAPSPDAAAPPSPALPSADEFARNWPRFRGPTGSGVAAFPDAPLKWDAKSGAGLVWKTAVPAPGFNSPIVWGDRVFLSGATKAQRDIFCFSATDGRLLWSCVIPADPRGPGTAKDPIEDTGFAAPTMATDGRHAFAIFATGTLAAVTFDGKLAWTKHLGTPVNSYGHATSLAVWEGRVIVQLDQGVGEGANSRLVAFDGLTGREVWSTPRTSPSSWATPIVIEAAGKTQIVTLGEPHVIAYAFADGAELWRAELLHGEITPSPIFAGGLVMAVNPSTLLAAIRPDGTGDVAATHVAWKAEDSMPDVTSPVSDGEFVFVVDNGGQLTCLDAKTGKKVWQHDLQMSVQASPAIAGRRLYVCGLEGAILVIEIGREYRELARNELGEKIFASPAFVGGRLILRGEKHLFCVGGPEPKT